MIKKKQIRINEATIKALIREAIQDKLNGVFSTDDPEAAEAVRNDTDPNDDWWGEGYSTKKNREDLANLIDKRSGGEDAELPLIHSRGDDWDDEYFENAAEEKAESDRFDKPFGDLDDFENEYPDGSDSVDGDDEFQNESRKRRQIRLSEAKLREFVSYSVAKLLREMKGRDLYDRNGEFDGSEDADYGTDSFVFEPDIDEYLDEDLEFPEYPQVRVYYTKTQGMRSRDRDIPDDDDSYQLDSWEIINPQGMPQEVLEAVKYYMENDFDIEEAANSGSIAGLNEGWDTSFSERCHKWNEEHPIDHEKNKGACAHFPGGTEFRPENPYKDAKGWDEYCEMKRKEREKDKEKSKPKKSDGKNRGVTVHFNK